MLNHIGLLGVVLLAVCAAPQAWHCYQTGNADGISHGLLWSWWLGEICTLIFVLGKCLDWRLALNYGANVILVGVIAWFKVMG